MANVNCVGTVLGARQTGKTSLLLRLRHALQGKYAFAFVNLQAVEGANLDGCLRYIAEEMVNQLAEITAGGPAPGPDDSKGFLGFLQHFSRASRAVRIAVILDEIGALPRETATKLASTIRAIFNNRIINVEYQRYVFMLSGATDMLELTTGRTSPLWNVTDSIYLGDLSLAEAGELLRHVFGEKPTRSSSSITRNLCNWTGGHPYWTQLLVGTLETNAKAPTKATIRDVVELLLQTEDRNLPHVFRSLDRAQKSLHKLMDSMLTGNPVPFSRSNGAVAELELIGVLKNQEGRCAIRNRIYEEAIRSSKKIPSLGDIETDRGRDFENWVESAAAKAETQGFKEWAGSARTTLALVFTDIVGSTSLQVELGDEAMTQVRRAHFQQARRFIDHFGGYEIKTSGDAFMVAFRTAAASLDFAVALSANTGDPRIKIRAGIHIGPVMIEEQDAFGSMVSYAARVESCAKGAEIWLSERAKDDIAQEKAKAHQFLLWIKHTDCELKGFPGKHNLWSVG